MVRAKTLLATLTSLLVAATAQAHFLWVDLVPSENGRFVCVSFSEEPGPGEAHLVDRISSTKAWVRRAQGEPQPLELSSIVDDESDEGYWSTKVKLDGATSVEAQCQYGVFQRGETSLLLNYFGKHLAAASPSEIAPLARAEQLTLDVVPDKVDGRWHATVYWQGQPAADVELIAADADHKTYEFKTDSQGRVQLPAAIEDRFSLRARHVEPTQAGEIDGKSYSQAWFISTATVAVADATADESASELLSEARASRAVWENFPGFTAAIRVHVDNHSETGNLTVDADGNVELNGLATLGNGFVRQQLDSLIMHRLPGSQFDDNATFSPETGEHVLGRLIELNEASMGSVYRIGENVVTEVNRSMGRQRFTISVLDVLWNKDHKYLPHIFTVSFWNNESGALDSSHTYYHRWQELESFDLPERFIVVTTGENRRSVLRIDFTELKLLDK